MDQVLRLDWPALLRFVDGRSYLAQPLNVAYRSFQTQFIWLPIILALSGCALRSYQMILMYAAIYFIGCVISIWYPAQGTYVTFNIHPDDLQNIDRTWGYVFLDELKGVKSDPHFVFNLAKAQGIMTFPSLHAASAVLFAWAAWELRWLRYPFLVLNIGMAISGCGRRQPLSRRCHRRHWSRRFRDCCSSALLSAQSRKRSDGIFLSTKFADHAFAFSVTREHQRSVHPLATKVGS
ncbi:phosphatase PAP2 family protein [Bradyrhizobium sp. Arg314]